MTQTWKVTSRLLAAGALVGATALAGPAAVPARAQAGPAAKAGDAAILDLIPAATRARMAAQVPLVDAATGLRAAVERGPARGYAGIGLVGDHVALWWKGELPADIASAVAVARRIAPVEVTPAAYAKAELAAAAERIAPVVDGDAGDAAHDVRLRTDGSGLEIVVDDADAALPKLPRTGVRTTVVQQERLVPRSREDDSAPWSGGARIWNDSGAGCSIGFGVREVAAGTNHLLSAGHCGAIGAQWSDGQGEPIGVQTHRNVDHDTMLIATPSAGGWIYVGGSNDNARARVVGWTQVFPGQLLCQSGATSAGVLGGPICDLEVQFHYTDREDLVEATQLDGDDSARGGDSGGPVYAVNSDGTVLAAGTTTRSAGPGFGFQDFATARDDFGDIVPVTGTAATCRISFTVTASWANGYTAAVTVYNDGPQVNNWTVGWTYGGGQLVQGGWNGVFQQTGPAVTVANESYNATIQSGGSVSFGFTASGPATNPAPFTLNGAACS
ncbi:cellulose binding domain-containing protein [Micromonospora okii]|uniref:cellulose binding domain-containing protein n=1 Tax=Micromonospora okii TaxID=1182970 RepID=UPI001E33F0C5|nr:cellulose binding domain-containing protein [Micromonospora okii]